jgi:hypothetical protein
MSRGGGGRRSRGTTRSARSWVKGAGEFGERAETLDGVSHVLLLQGQCDRATELKERPFAAHRRRGKRVEAAELARWLAFLRLSGIPTFNGVIRQPKYAAERPTDVDSAREAK